MSPRKARTSKPVLIVQHAFYEHPAVIRRALQTQGVPTRLIHPYQGEAYPDPDGISGMISLGGPMGANDEAHHPWILQECRLLAECVRAELPVVGVCLGGQMMARGLGARVERNPVAEVGWFPIEVSEAGKKDRVIGAAGDNPLVYHWHNDTFQLPDGAELLAQSRSCPRQAYRVGEKAYGFQFHPEADHQLIHEWLSVEGVEDEVLEAQKEHGKRAVQSVKAQKSWALKGEKASLKITAAFCQLFKRADYEGVSPDLHENYHQWATMRTALIVEFVAADGSSVQLRGQILTLLSVPDGEFVIFRDEDTLLWPIRMDHLTRVIPSSR
jgi:GMP synthase-like glutamine amidotransferase